MHKFSCWVKSIAHWIWRVPVAPHYWYALGALIASLGLCSVSGWSETAFRLWGMSLQLFGVLTVVYGIWKTRADFEQPTLRENFGSWFRNFPKWNPPPTILSPSGIDLGLSASGHLITTSGPSVDRTVEGRLRHLESSVSNLEKSYREMHTAVLVGEEKAQQTLGSQNREFGKQIDAVYRKVETTATSGIHVSALGVILLFFGTIFGSAAPELSKWLAPYQMSISWKEQIMVSDVNKFLSDYLAPASAALAALVAYIAVYKNSQPQVVAYYQPSKRQQSIIELVIENVGTGNAYGLNFSKPIPISCFGIETPKGEGRYIPTSGIPSLAPGQRLVFLGGQYSGLLKAVGAEGMPLDISYKFHPPLWFKKNATDTCVLSVKHLEGMATVKSIEQAVVDAIEGHNTTTIKDIRDSLQNIEQHLAKISTLKNFDKE